MSCGSNQSNVEQSQFFKGRCIFSKLKNSNFEKVKTTIVDIFGEDGLKKYRLPKIICIGNESTGKSSLLENITKCQIFPRNYKLCTKTPVHVIMKNGPALYKINFNFPEKGFDNMELLLTNKQEIYPNIKDILEKMEVDALYENEIIITIQEPNMYSFELYDLPGIRTYPEEVAKKSIDITKKYLSDPNCIVLCVVPATTTRLTSCQSIALVNEYKKNDNCILALTMSDRVQEENIEELLIDRLAGISDELNGLNLYGCVAVINRTHKDIHSLLQGNVKEIIWFNENVVSLIPEWNPKDSTKKIINNITVTNLIDQIDNLYNKFIHNDWKPIISKDIEIEKEYLNIKYQKLGTLDLDVKKITLDIKKKVIKSLILFLNKDIDFSKIVYLEKKEIINTLSGIDDTFDNLHYNKYNDICLKICQISNFYFAIRSSKLIEKLINETIDPIFDDTSLPNRLDRFQSLNDEIKNQMLEIYERRFYKKIKEIQSILFDNINAHLLNKNYDNYPFEQYLNKYYKCYIVLPIFETFEYDFTEHDFVENEVCALLRTDLNEQIINIEKHYKKIQEQI